MQSPSGRSQLGGRFTLADLTVDLGRHAVTRQGAEVPLPRLSFELLVALARAAPDVVSSDALLERVWKGLVVGPETITQRVKLLRDAIGDDPRAPRYIQSVRGRGYRLLPEVCTLDPALSVDGASGGAVAAPSRLTPTSSRSTHWLV